MNQLISRFSLTLIVCLVSTTASAQDAFPSMSEYKHVAASGTSVLHVIIDNDSLLLNKDDGFYTSGIQVSSRKALNTTEKSVVYGWQLGQDLYTASDIKLYPDEILPIDHPYAGWIYAGVFKESSDVTGWSTRIGFDLGCLGPCAAGERTQTLLHRLLKQPLPQGWSSQLQQEWGVVLSGEWSPARWLLAKNIDLQPRVKARFGNIFTDASIDTTVRFGQLNSLPEQIVNCGFLRTEIKLIGYDATLQGGYFNNQMTTAHLQRSIGELELGYQWRSGNYGLFASVVRRSSAIKDLPNNLGAQNFVRLQFNYAMN